MDPDPDPGGSKTYGSDGSATLRVRIPDLFVSLGLEFLKLLVSVELLVLYCVPTRILNRKYTILSYVSKERRDVFSTRRVKHYRSSFSYKRRGTYLFSIDDNCALYCKTQPIKGGNYETLYIKLKEKKPLLIADSECLPVQIKRQNIKRCELQQALF
jgi:hypothetical protein